MRPVAKVVVAVLLLVVANVAKGQYFSTACLSSTSSTLTESTTFAGVVNSSCNMNLTINNSNRSVLEVRFVKSNFTNVSWSIVVANGRGVRMVFEDCTFISYPVSTDFGPRVPPLFNVSGLTALQPLSLVYVNSSISLPNVQFNSSRSSLIVLANASSATVEFLSSRVMSVTECVLVNASNVSSITLRTWDSVLNVTGQILSVYALMETAAATFIVVNSEASTWTLRSSSFDAHAVSVNTSLNGPPIASVTVALSDNTVWTSYSKNQMIEVGPVSDLRISVDRSTLTCAGLSTANVSNSFVATVDSSTVQQGAYCGALLVFEGNDLLRNVTLAVTESRVTMCRVIGINAMTAEIIELLFSNSTVDLLPVSDPELAGSGLLAVVRAARITVTSVSLRVTNGSEIVLSDRNSSLLSGGLNTTMEKVEFIAAHSSITSAQSGGAVVSAGVTTNILMAIVATNATNLVLNSATLGLSQTESSDWSVAMDSVNWACNANGTSDAVAAFGSITGFTLTVANSYLSQVNSATGWVFLTGSASSGISVGFRLVNFVSSSRLLFVDAISVSPSADFVVTLESCTARFDFSTTNIAPLPGGVVVTSPPSAVSSINSLELVASNSTILFLGATSIAAAVLDVGQQSTIHSVKVSVRSTIVTELRILPAAMPHYYMFSLSSVTIAVFVCQELTVNGIGILQTRYPTTALTMDSLSLTVSECSWTVLSAYFVSLAYSLANVSTILVTKSQLQAHVMISSSHTAFFSIVGSMPNAASSMTIVLEQSNLTHSGNVYYAIVQLSGSSLGVRAFVLTIHSCNVAVNSTSGTLLAALLFGSFPSANVSLVVNGSVIAVIAGYVSSAALVSIESARLLDVQIVGCHMNFTFPMMNWPILSLSYVEQLGLLSILQSNISLDSTSFLSYVPVVGLGFSPLRGNAMGSIVALRDLLLVGQIASVLSMTSAATFTGANLTMSRIHLNSTSAASSTAVGALLLSSSPLTLNHSRLVVSEVRIEAAISLSLISAPYNDPGASVISSSLDMSNVFFGPSVFSSAVLYFPEATFQGTTITATCITNAAASSLSIAALYFSGSSFSTSSAIVLSGFTWTATGSSFTPPLIDVSSGSGTVAVNLSHTKYFNGSDLFSAASTMPNVSASICASSVPLPLPAQVTPFVTLRVVSNCQRLCATNSLSETALLSPTAQSSRSQTVQMITRSATAAATASRSRSRSESWSLTRATRFRELFSATASLSQTSSHESSTKHRTRHTTHGYGSATRTTRSFTEMLPFAAPLSSAQFAAAPLAQAQSSSNVALISSVALGGDPATATQTAFLSIVACTSSSTRSGSESVSDDPVSTPPPSTLTMLTISVFYRHGPLAMALGNLGLIIVFSAIYAAVTLLVARRFGTSFVVAAERKYVRFPSIPLRVAAFLIPGTVYGAFLLLLDPSSGTGAYVGGSLLVVPVLGFVAARHLIVSRIAVHRAQYVAYPPDVLQKLSLVEASLFPNGRWCPRKARYAFGLVLTPYSPRAVTLATVELSTGLCLAAVTAVATTRTVAVCAAIMQTMAALHFAVAVWCAVLRPFRLKSDASCAAITYLLYGTVCLLLSLHRVAAAADVQAACAGVSVVRVVIGFWMSHREDQFELQVKDGKGVTTTAEYGQIPAEEKLLAASVLFDDHKRSAGGELGLDIELSLLPINTSPCRVPAADVEDVDPFADSTPPSPTAVAVPVAVAAAELNPVPPGPVRPHTSHDPQHEEVGIHHSAADDNSVSVFLVAEAPKGVLNVLSATEDADRHSALFTAGRGTDSLLADLTGYFKPAATETSDTARVEAVEALSAVLAAAANAPPSDEEVMAL